MTVKPLPMAPEVKVEAEYDPLKYPVKAAFEIAVGRAARAARYAAKFPNFVRAEDMKYQDVGWQYEHEGLAAVKKPETHLVT